MVIILDASSSIRGGNGRALEEEGGRGRGGGSCNCAFCIWLYLVLCSGLIDGVIKVIGTKLCSSGTFKVFGIGNLKADGPNGEREGNCGGRMLGLLCVMGFSEFMVNL